MVDLWPKDLEEITKTASTAPLTLLKEQASVLARRTNGLLQGNVESYSRSVYGKTLFAHSFEITAPALEGYRYSLFSIEHDVEMYPVKFKLEDAITSELWPDKGGDVEASSEDEFIECLGRIFNSKKSRKVIGALLSQLES
jgi:hypothetical protein